jgi:outer membrane protein assembly factor BamB
LAWAPAEDGRPLGSVTLDGGAPGNSNPVVAEIDGDPTNGLEIAIGGSNGILSVLRADGSLLWTQHLPSYGCTGSSSWNRLHSSPSVGDLFGNEQPHVLIGYGGIGGKCDGGVSAFKGSDGTLVWNFSTKAHAKKEGYSERMFGVFSTPALADTDGDGKLEVGFGSFARRVFLLEATGQVRWYYVAADTVWSSPAFANVDSDSKLEMIIGTDISKNTKLKPPTPNGGYIYALKTDKRKEKKIGFRKKGPVKWYTAVEQTVFSSPVVANVLASNGGDEIIVASGCYFPERTKKKVGKWVKVLDEKTGKVLATLPTTGCSSSSVAVGDIDNDGVYEIFTTVNGYSDIGGDGQGRLMAFRADSITPLWSIEPQIAGSNDAHGGDFASPVVADVDGNGSLEVFVAQGSGIGAFDASTGTSLTCPERSCDSLMSLHTGSKTRSTPAIADADLDGVPEVYFSSRSGTSKIFRFAEPQTHIPSLDGAQDLYSAPFPMWRGSPRRAGN